MELERQTMRLCLRLGFLLLMATACGADTNIFGYITPSSQKESFDQRLALGTEAFDRKDYAKANEIAKALAAQDPLSEGAAQLLGYSYLALAGIAPFDIARQMMAEKPQEPATSNTPDAPAGQDTDTNSQGAVGSATVKIMQEMKGLVGLTELEIQSLGVLENSDAEFPVVIPSCLEASRKAIAKIRYMNAAIAAICPFVSPELRQNDSRHKCHKDSVVRSQLAKSHFLWAFTHLTEGLLFHSVLTYGSSSSDARSNLEKRADKVFGLDIEGIDALSSYTKRVNKLAKLMDQVLPTGTDCSATDKEHQLAALSLDMDVANKTFKAMPGTPKKMVASLGQLMDSIYAVTAKVGGKDPNDDSNDSRAKAFKADFSAAMAQSFGAQLEQLSALEGLSESDRNQLCGAFDGMTGESIAPDDKPSLCQ